EAGRAGEGKEGRAQEGSGAGRGRAGRSGRGSKAEEEGPGQEEGSSEERKRARGEAEEEGALQKEEVIEPARHPAGRFLTGAPAAPPWSCRRRAPGRRSTRRARASAPRRPAGGRRWCR